MANVFGWVWYRVSDSEGNKAWSLEDHLAENPTDEEYEPLKTYFHDEEVSFVGENISEAYPVWRWFFDGAENHQGKGIREVLVLESCQHYLMAAKLRFNCTKTMAEYEAYILSYKMAMDMNVYELLVIGDQIFWFIMFKVNGFEEPKNYTLRTVCAKSV